MHFLNLCKEKFLMYEDRAKILLFYVNCLLIFSSIEAYESFDPLIIFQKTITKYLHTPYTNLYSKLIFSLFLLNLSFQFLIHLRYFLLNIIGMLSICLKEFLKLMGNIQSLNLSFI